MLTELRKALPNRSATYVIDMLRILGRRDSQIKCCGYRIELAEIEAALHTISGLTESAVVALPSERFEGSIICCAYCAVSDLGVNPVALHRELSRMIPNYSDSAVLLGSPDCVFSTITGCGESHCECHST